MLANIYLHHVLDEWFTNEVKPRMQGHCFIVRFADDFIIGSQHEVDAKRIMQVIPKRFEKFGLTIHPEKTKMIPFGKPASNKEVSKGEKTFDFLGFTHYWARTRVGYWVIKRKTAKKKMRKSIVAMREWCRNNRHKPLKWQCQMLSSKLRGHFQYFGVRCNMRSMEAVRHFVIRGWQYWLSRRSHKSAIPWDQFMQLLEAFPSNSKCEIELLSKKALDKTINSLYNVVGKYNWKSRNHELSLSIRPKTFDLQSTR